MAGTGTPSALASSPRVRTSANATTLIGMGFLEEEGVGWGGRKGVEWGLVVGYRHCGSGVSFGISENELDFDRLARRNST